MTKRNLAIFAIVALLGAQNVMAKQESQPGEYKPVRSGGDWVVSRDGGKTFSSGGIYTSEKAAQRAANKINRKARRAAKKAAKGK